MRSILALFLAAATAGVTLPAAAEPVRPDAAAVPADSAATIEALQRLAERLRRLEEDGLDPEHYAIPPEALAARNPPAFRQAVLRAAEAALTDLLHGRVASLPDRPDLLRDTASVPLAPWFAELASSGEPAAVIERASLRHPEAAAIRAELARLRAIAAAGGYPAIPSVPDNNGTLEPGSTDPLRVPMLRARLAMERRSPARAADADNPAFDAALVEKVKRFQAAEGLEPDGRVGRLTLAALNRPVEARIRQLRVALDMRRAAAPPPAERRIEVNVPHYRLQLLEGDRAVMEMPVIVGRSSRATPMMRVRMTAVQFNPPWGVPERNAREDLLPRFRRDPVAMREKGFRLFTTVEGQRVEVDPTTVDWSTVNPNRFPYYVRQDAGDANALGRMKFIMPNTQDIFMHDTPDRHLFRRTDRAFSSGCIRLDRPMDLLEAALQGTPGWDRARADRALEARTTSAVTLARSIPVRLHYTTVVIENGALRIRPDIYGLDEAYARAMDRPATPRVAAAGARGR